MGLSMVEEENAPGQWADCTLQIEELQQSWGLWALSEVANKLLLNLMSKSNQSL